MLLARRISAIAVIICSAAACASDKSAPSVDPTSTVTVPQWTYSTKSDEARKHVETGERLWDTGYLVPGHEEFKRAVAADSSFAYAYLRVAQTAFSAEEFETNLARAQAHVKTANPTETLLIQNSQKLDDNDLQAALALNKQLTMLEPKNARSWLLLAGTFTSLNQTADARAAFERAISLDTAYAAAQFALANSYVFSEPKDYQKAEQYALAGQRSWPKEPVSFDNIGIVRRAQNRLDDAIAAYTREVELAPGESNGIVVRGNANTFAAHYEAARADYDAALRVAKPGEIAVTGLDRGYVNCYQGNVDACLTELVQFRTAIDGLHVESPEQDKANVSASIFTIANYQKRYGVADSALKIYALVYRAIAKASKSAGFVRSADAQVAYMEGEMAALKGDLATARARADDIIRIRQPDNDPTKEYPVHRLRGLIAYAEKNYQVAITELTLADPPNALMTCLYYRALATAATGKTAEAKEILQKVATFNFNGPDYAAIRFDAIAKLKSLQ